MEFGKSTKSFSHEKMLKLVKKGGNYADAKAYFKKYFAKIKNPPSYLHYEPNAETRNQFFDLTKDQLRELIPHGLSHKVQFEIGSTIVLFDPFKWFTEEVIEYFYLVEEPGNPRIYNKNGLIVINTALDVKAVDEYEEYFREYNERKIDFEKRYDSLFSQKKKVKEIKLSEKDYDDIRKNIMNNLQ